MKKKFPYCLHVLFSLVIFAVENKKKETIKNKEIMELTEFGKDNFIELLNEYLNILDQDDKLIEQLEKCGINFEFTFGITEKYRKYIHNTALKLFGADVVDHIEWFIYEVYLNRHTDPSYRDEPNAWTNHGKKSWKIYSADILYDFIVAIDDDKETE